MSELRLIDVEKLIEKLDLLRIRETMHAMHWCWGGTKEAPSTSEMKDLLRELAGRVNRPKVVQVSSGGFTLWRDEHGSYGCYFAIDSVRISKNDEAESLKLTPVH